MPNRMLTKLAAKLLWFTLVFCPAVSVATGCAAAQTPVPGSDYARLQNLTSQLQTSPANDALRKQIIALALKLPTPPNETSAAIEAQGAGKFAFHHAQSAVDFYNAGQAFDHAALLAPWMAANYYNAAQAYAKTAHLNRAIADLRWYLKAAPNAEDKDAVLEQIGGLKYAQQHPVSRHTTTPTAAATAAQAQAAVAQAALARYLGNWQVRQATLSGRSVSCMWTLTINERQMIFPGIGRRCGLARFCSDSREPVRVRAYRPVAKRASNVVIGAFVKSNVPMAGQAILPALSRCGGRLGLCHGLSARLIVCDGRMNAGVLQGAYTLQYGIPIAGIGRSRQVPIQCRNREVKVFCFSVSLARVVVISCHPGFDERRLLERLRRAGKIRLRLCMFECVFAGALGLKRSGGLRGWRR